MATSAEYVKKVRLTAVPAVYLLLVRGTKVFMMLREKTGYMDGNWDVPSGHMEEDELPVEAMIREGKEETGVIVSAPNLSLVHTSYRPRHDETGNRVDLFFLAGIWKGEPINAEPHKCARTEWCDTGKLPENTVPHVRQAIAAYYRGQIYSELGLEWMLKEKSYQL